MAPKIRACIFDMDGLLLDTEQVYTDVTNELLASYGKPNLPLEIKAQMMGRPGPYAAQVLIDWANLPVTASEYFAETSKRQTELWPAVRAMPGAVELIQHLKEHGIPIAVATSSHRRNFELKSEAHVDTLFKHFGEHVIVGDDPRIPPGRGKPYPDIWLLALNTLNASLASADPSHVPILPSECLVFEDSVLGVESGRAAGMNVVWVPDGRIKAVFEGKDEEILGVDGVHIAVDELGHLDLEGYGLPRMRIGELDN
ncbi:hypothetical protein YB2330_001107 [Saitoella coloradoensis]